MPDEIMLMHSTSEALVQTTEATHLVEQRDRVVSAMVKRDAPQILDTTKALLESVFKTILTDRKGALEGTPNFSPLYRMVISDLKLSQNEKVCGLLEKLGSGLVHQIGELRNAFGASSHGKDGYATSPVEMDEAFMVVQIVDGLAGFLLKKHKASSDPKLAARIHYADYPEFNDFLDELDEGYTLPFGSSQNLHFSASQLLFTNDQKAYRDALLQFINSEEDDD